MADVKKTRLLLLIITLGIFLRLFPIPELNSGLISTAHGIGKVVEAREAAHALYLIIGHRIPFLKERWAKKLGDEIKMTTAPPDQGPLRPLILYSFMFFGRDEFIIRLPALLFGIGCILLIYDISVRKPGLRGQDRLIKRSSSFSISLAH